jgi:uncharacterized protein (TIGR02246 family)
MQTIKNVFAGLVVAALAMSHAHAQTNNQVHPDTASSKLLTEARLAIARGNALWSEGWKKGDADMVAAIFAKDGVQLSLNGKVIKGRQQILERQTIAMQSVDPGVIVTVTTVDVWLVGETAYETGKYKYEYSEKGKPGTDEGRYVTMWKRQMDGSWKLYMDMGVPKD